MDAENSEERLPHVTPAPRIGDAEREQAAAALSDHFAAGRIDRDEFDVRLSAAYRARTAADLKPLFADLPTRAADPAPAAAALISSRRERRVFVVPIFPILILVAALVTIASDGRFPFIIFPLLWVMGGFRHRRGYRGYWGH